VSGTIGAAYARLPVASARVVWREARRSLGRRWWLLAALVVVLLVAATAGLVAPLALGAVVDAISTGTADAPLVWTLGAAMAGAIVIGSVFAAAGVVIGSRLFESMLADLRERMVDTAFTLPQSQVERAGTGDLIARAGDDVAAVAEAIPNVVPALTGSLFTIAVTVVGMAVIDPWYALALAVIVPVHALAVRWYLRRAPSVYAAERAAMADRAQQLLDSLHGLETVRAYGLGRRHADRIAASSWAVVRWAMQARAIQNTFFARLNFAEYLGMAGLLVVGFVLVATGNGTIGATTAAMLLFLRLFDPINYLLFVIDELQSALASLGRIVGVIAAVPDARAGSRDDGPVTDAPAGSRASRPVPDAPRGSRADGPVPAAAADASATLAFRGVHHSYTPGHEVLHDITLTLRPGETVAVVGASGAGKSTLAALAAGIHVPDDGDVVRPREPGATVLVTQEVHVFDGTLRDNLTLARPGASDADLTEALRGIGASALLDDFAEGLDTPVGAEAASVTPSQAQQLALARVRLADPRLVILDEATAEAGSTDAGRLDHAAAAVLEGRTGLVVAHRLSQAASADRVVVMARGRVVELGTHAELLARDGEYARLWAAWSRAR
jgi:ATP-binding cassette subfamily C protein